MTYTFSIRLQPFATAAGSRKIWKPGKQEIELIAFSCLPGFLILMIAEYG
jgi:hypothetical protein